MEPLPIAARQLVGQAAVTGTDVDGDAAPIAGKELSESVVRSLEALPAHDVHGVSSGTSIVPLYPQRASAAAAR